jgi:MFS family permease
LQSYIRLIRDNPNFARLWFAQIISLLGDWFNTIALSVLVAQYSGGSGIAISLYLMLRFLPELLFGPFAGMLVDRFDRKLILVYCNFFRMFIVAGFLFASSPDRLWMIYVLTIFQFIMSSMFEPAQAAITPALVKRADLVKANTISSITWSVMLAVGAIIGGIVAQLLGTQVSLMMGASMFGLASLLLTRIDVPRSERIAKHQHESGGSFFEGLRFVRNHPNIGIALTVKAGGSIGNMDTLMTLYATQIFIIGSGGQLSLGILYSAFGLGAFLGPMLMNRFNNGSVRRMTTLILLGFLLMTLGWGLLGVFKTFALIILGIGIRAMGSSINWTYSTVIVQKSAPDEFLGRMFSLDFAGFQLVTVISIMAHGWLADKVRAGAQMPLLQGDLSPILMGFEQMISRPILADGLNTLALITGVISLVPLTIWALFYFKGSQSEIEQSQIEQSQPLSNPND